MQKNNKFTKIKNKAKRRKINQLKSKMKHRTGRCSKKDKKSIFNIEKRKKLPLEIKQHKSEIRKLKKKIEEHNHYKEKIQQMFKSKTLKTAMKRFNQLQDKIDELPKIIADYIKNLSKKLQRAFEYTQDQKIPKTNNLIELLFRTTFP